VIRRQRLRRTKQLQRTRRLRLFSSAQREFLRNYAPIRRYVLERDHHRCRYCGTWSEEVHHVTKRSQDKTLRCDPNNLVTLCPGPQGCHAWTDGSGMGRRGRLVVTALGQEKFAFHIQDTDKFTARRVNELGAQR
jgi:5-methylcytosine-specific restriction endonuclease McrA